MISFGRQQIDQLEKRFRTTFVNSLTGYKSANLIGTTDTNGQENLAIFSSLTHIGADPALLGFIMRPTSSERHTYQNIASTGIFTVNAVSKALSARAHATAARYDRSISEFEACGIQSEYLNGFKAPFVKESPVRLGCSFCEELLIIANNTRLVIGQIDCVYLDEGLLKQDGYVDLYKGAVMAISSLDGYHNASKPERYSYAKPNMIPKRIN